MFVVMLGKPRIRGIYDFMTSGPCKGPTLGWRICHSARYSPLSVTLAATNSSLRGGAGGAVLASRLIVEIKGPVGVASRVGNQPGGMGAASKLLACFLHDSVGDSKPEQLKGPVRNWLLFVGCWKRGRWIEQFVDRSCHLMRLGSGTSSDCPYHKR